MSHENDPAPGDGVQTCLWAGEGGYKTVHLWGDEVRAIDSAANRTWRVRRCVICPAVDAAYLREQHEARVRAQKA